MENKKKKTVTFDPVLQEQQKKVIISKENVIEDVVLMMNPHYENLIEPSIVLLQSLGFGIIDNRFVKLEPSQIKQILSKRYQNSSFMESIITHFSAPKVMFFHVTRLNASKEIDNIMRKFFTRWDDTLEYKMIERPFKEHVFPFLFVPMDSPQMYEDSLKIMSPYFFSFWGQDVLALNKIDKDKLLNGVILSTVGDDIMKDDVTKQLMLKEFFNKPRESKAVHYVVRAPKQGMFEIRVQNKYGKLNSRKKREESKTAR